MLIFLLWSLLIKNHHRILDVLTFFFVVCTFILAIKQIKDNKKKEEDLWEKNLLENINTKILKDMELRAQTSLGKYKNGDFSFINETWLKKNEKCYGKIEVSLIEQKEKEDITFKHRSVMEYHVEKTTKTIEEIVDSWILYITDQRIFYEWEKLTKTYALKDFMTSKMLCNATDAVFKIFTKHGPVDTYLVKDYLHLYEVIYVFNHRKKTKKQIKALNHKKK